MAIAFVTVIGLLLAGALSYAAVSMKASSTKYTPARDRLYGADAGTKAAMLSVAAKPETGQALPGVTCNVVKTYGTVRNESIDFQVCPQGAGATGSFPTPGSAFWGLITLDATANKGVTITGANALQINGNVYSNSNIATGTGSLVVKQGSLYATGCSGTVTVDGTKNCASSGSGTAKDPGYLPGITTVPANATVASACSSGGSSGVVQINAGTWTAATVTAATGCSNVWLKPGIHYINNLNWSIGRKVVAGTLPASGASGISGTSIPGGCVDTSPGAMLYLAGTSAITMASGGSLQVCGMAVTQANGRSVKLPLYDSVVDLGALNDTLTGTGAHEYNCGGSNGNDGPSRLPHGGQRIGDSNNQPCEWQNVPNGAVIDAAVASDAGIKKSARTSTITIDLTGTRSIPASVTTLTLNVMGVSTRTSSSGSANASYNIKVLNADGSTACNPAGSQTMATGASLPASPDSFTVSCSAGMVGPLQVEFYATASNSDGTRTIKLDGITASWSVPAPLKAHSAATAFTSTTGGFVWFGGEIYLPASAMSLTASKINGVFSTLGAVMKSLTYNADSATTDVIGSGNNTYTAGGDVLVKTKVGTKDWVTCRITYVLNGQLGTPTLKGCTVPR